MSYCSQERQPYYLVMKSKQYSDLDREIIVLSAVWHLIGSMVHYAHFEKGHPLSETMLKFKTRECGNLFLIILADFLSLPRSGTFGLSHRLGSGSLAETYLGNLLEIGANPHFGGDTSLLSSSATSFAEWLDGSVTVEKVWLPSIEREGAITVRRMSYLRICGTASKHGFTRLGDIVKKIQKVMTDNGTAINEGQSYLLIPEFQEWFRDHVFVASSTTIAFFLNEVRWGIFRYLQTEFERAYQPHISLDFQTYRFDVPTEITDPMIRSMYWDLMNEVRSEPHFPRFTVDKYLRDEF
jgi:hypothetical protein